FGIREHAMGTIVNGLSLSKLRAFGATFFIFSDYARPAMRLSALMELPTIFVFTHDAMGDGEDGPTHQPVEHLASLRAMPGLVTLRPGDANEVVEAYRKRLGEDSRGRVSLGPSGKFRDRRTQGDRDSVLPPAVKARVAVEQASTIGWERYVGSAGRVIGMHTFGASAPLKALQEEFGFEPDRVVASAKELLGKQ